MQCYTVKHVPGWEIMALIYEIIPIAALSEHYFGG
jgi:hypothetical protein